MGERAEVESYLRAISVEAKSCELNDSGSVDCAYFCRCDDGSDYAVKNSDRNASLPHQEWFCTRLGELAGLVSPAIRIVRVDGRECFGSRWESGIETGTNNQNGWWTRAKTGEIDFSLLAPTLSRILAFDLFVHNVDRHLANYLVVKQRSGHAILAFDYSQAWIWNGLPPPPLPLGQQTNTVIALKILRRLFGEFIQFNEASLVCQKLRSIKISSIEAIILEHPSIWLTNQQKDGILTWWNSVERDQRLSQVEEGIKNGSYL
ncbi:HipA family kinase [Mesorhizobium sp. M1396]|uniref:HipA family kinase n=1 Tax=Mesorhizobium sp. M1396 TaxID=2957095 RepID=UPI0033376548